jgi:hypothetical protein
MGYEDSRPVTTWCVGVSFRGANLKNPQVNTRKGPKSSVHLRKSFSGDVVPVTR